MKNLAVSEVNCLFNSLEIGGTRSGEAEPGRSVSFFSVTALPLHTCSSSSCFRFYFANNLKSSIFVLFFKILFFRYIPNFVAH